MFCDFSYVSISIIRLKWNKNKHTNTATKKKNVNSQQYSRLIYIAFMVNTIIGLFIYFFFASFFSLFLLVETIFFFTLHIRTYTHRTARSKRTKQESKNYKRTMRMVRSLNEYWTGMVVSFYYIHPSLGVTCTVYVYKCVVIVAVDANHLHFFVRFLFLPLFSSICLSWWTYKLHIFFNFVTFSHPITRNWLRAKWLLLHLLMVNDFDR